MRRRIIGLVAAVVLAALGTVALVAYVQSARDDAVADEKLVEVYVVADPIARGTLVADIGSRVKTVDVPARLLADDVVNDLDDLNDEFVAAVNLQPGEQLLASRFVDERSLGAAEVPTGLQEVTVALDPERAVGGEILPGETVGVVLSFDPFDLAGSSTDQADPADQPSTAGADVPNKSPNMTHLTFHKVLVTRVQFDATSSSSSPIGDDDEEDEDREVAPGGTLLVTLALGAPEVEQFVFAAEFGHIWLTAENSDAVEDGTRIVTLEEVFDPAPDR